MKATLLTILFFCLLFILCMLAYSLTRKDRLRSIYLTALCSAVGMYLFGYILELTSPTREAAIIALKVENVGIPLVAPFFLLFMLDICRYRVVRPWMAPAALLYGMSMTACIVLNEHHLLYYPAIERLPVWDMHYLLLGHGPLYYLQQGIALACALAAYGALAARMIRWSSRMRRQMLFITLGSLVSLTSHVLYFTRILSQQIDPTPISMSITLLFFLVGVIRYRLFNISGIAMETVIASMDDAVVVLDYYWCYQSANLSAEKLFPGLGELVSSAPISRLAGWPKELAVHSGAGQHNFDLPDWSGGRQYFRANVSPVDNGSKTIGWSVVIRDITEMTEMIDKMQELAITDPLTGIYNRRYFMENVQRQLNIARREKKISAIAIFDIDYFKRVNDTYGHQVGDIVLLMVAEAIKKELRSYDFFARYGGEEFALYAINIKGQDLVKFGWRLCRAIESMQIPHQGSTIQVTASFGLVEVPWDALLEDAIQAADAAMYRAKQNGRNRVEFGIMGESPVCCRFSRRAAPYPARAVGAEGAAAIGD